MANRYWVGGSATWDATAGSKWALTSGGAGGQAVPTTSDTVFFDANSGASTVTIGSGVATCSTLTMTGFTGTLAFGSNRITCAGTGTIYTGATTFSVTGTPVINCTNSSSTTRSLNPSATTESNAISFNITAGTGSFSLTNGSYKNLDFTGFTGTLPNTGKTIYGSLTLGTGMTCTDGANGTTFASTLVQQNITSNGVAFNVPIVMSGTQTFQLQDALTLASTRTFTLTSGTLDLNSKTLTCGIFSSSNSNTRSILFGTGNITLTGSGTTILAMTTATGFTYIGTPTINCTYSGSTGTRTVLLGTGGSETNALSINISAGTDIFILAGLGYYKNVNFTGFTGTLGASTLSRNIYGNLTISSGMTVQTATGTVSFGATSGTQQITTNGNSTIDFPITQNSPGATVQLQDNLTIGSTQTFTLTSGTLDLNNQTLTTGLFSSSNSNTRSILFGTGNITLTGSNATIWGAATSTNLTYTGTPTVNCTYSGSTGTRTITSTTGVTEATALNFNISAGSDIVGTTSTGSFKNLNFTGFSGTLGNNIRIIYGNLTLSSGMTCTAGASATTFSATSGTQQITTNGNATIDFPITFAGTATYQLQDALTIGATRTATLTTGTLDLNGKTLTCGLFSSNNSNTRAISFGTGNISINGRNTTVLAIAQTGFSITGTPTVNLTGAGVSGETRSINMNNALTESNVVDLYVKTGADIVSSTGTGLWVGTLDFTGFTGTFTRTLNNQVYRNLVLASGMTYTATTSAITFAGTVTSQQNITNNGVNPSCPLSFNGTTVYQFQDAFTNDSASSILLTSGTLDLNGKTITTGLFSSNNSNTRSIAFGTGNITVTGSNATIWNTATATNFSYTGTPTVNCTYSGATGTRVISNGHSVGGTETNAVSFNITAGTDTLQLSSSITNSILNLNFTGFAGTFTNFIRTIYGSLTLSSGMILSLLILY